MKRTILALLGVAVIALAWWMYRRGTAPPEVPFAKARRERLVSTLVTNGKVEPLEWASVRAERPGLLVRVYVDRGQRVAKGAPLAEFSTQEAEAGLAAAEARIAQARAEIEQLEAGGRPAELATIDGDLANARLELEAAEKEQAALSRLLDKQAATRQELELATQRADKSRAVVQALEKRRTALVSRPDRSAAQARLEEAEAAARLARLRLEQALLRSPMAGVVYDQPARSGSYLNPGDLVASVGQIDRVRVRVYVDEPELGRVARNLPVTITWDALPGKQWRGVVERTPTEVVALGTRQVGEVLCMIDNPGGELLPGTNINAEILSEAVDNALTIPREALRKSSDATGVFLLQGGRVAWRGITTGTSSITRVQVIDGLNEGDSVALPTDVLLADGFAVRPVYP